MSFFGGGKAEDRFLAAFERGAGALHTIAASLAEHDKRNSIRDAEHEHHFRREGDGDPKRRTDDVQGRGS